MQRKTIIVAIFILVFTSPCGAQKTLLNTSLEPSSTGPRAEDFEAVVLPIADIKVRLNIEMKLATGFCLDPSCRFIGTNYHVAMMARPRKIGGQTVVHRYLATGPDDEGATVNEGPFVSSMRFNLSRDLAIFELRQPLRQYHGISFYRKDLQIGQAVDIYSYPKESMIHTRKLLQVHGTFTGQTPTGLLAFEYDLSNGRTVRPGASGGIVIDRKSQQIVGVLNAIERGGKAIALAVPIGSLEDFVSRVQPYLAQSIFPSPARISPVSSDIYPRFVPTSTNVVQHRPEESSEVRALRTKAQELADGMRDFVAVQTFAWGAQDDEPLAEAQYEVQVLGGSQRFRELPDGKKEFKEVPFPPLSGSMIPVDQWSTLPALVGTDLNLKINQAAEMVLDGRSIKVFQYSAGVEDGVCAFKSVTDFGFFAASRTVTTACYGEVWTDEDLNILRMSEHLELFGRWKNSQAVVTYGWLKKADDAPRLIPLTIAAQAEYKKKIYWCRGQFTDYHLFTTRARIVASADWASSRVSPLEDSKVASTRTPASPRNSQRIRAATATAEISPAYSPAPSANTHVP